MGDLIHTNEIIGKLPNIVFNEDENGGIHCDLSGIAQNITCDKETKMSEIVREMTREELVSFNNKLREENEKLKEELHDARFAEERNNNLIEQEKRLRHELYRKDGEISGLRFALRCITEGCRTKAVLDEVER